MRLDRIAAERFEREVLCHLDAAMNLALWFGLQHHDAEDAIQTASLKAYKSFKQFRGLNAKAWFLSIVRNECLGILRASARRNRMELELNEQTVLPLSKNGPDTNEEPTELMTAVACLPALFREVILLREIEALSYREIAQIIDMPIGTVMSRLSRARSALRQAVRSSE